jgi:hypothetical protein
MITRFANLTSRLALALAILFTFAACGGGGGSSGGNGDGFLGAGNGDDENTYFLLLDLLDPSGEPTNAVTSTDPATVRVRVTEKNRNGKPVPDVVVRATADIGVLVPENGSALTNDDGVAELQVTSDGVLGAGTVEVAVDSPAGTVTGRISYQINYADLQLGYFAGDSFMPGEIGVNASSLPSGGSAVLTINVVDAIGETVATVEEIAFQSRCTRSGLATIVESPVATENGLATATYTATGCSGIDNITATLAGGSSQAMVSLEIAEPAAGSIRFVSAEPKLLALKSTGGPGRQENSAVSFQVVNGTGTPVSGVPVALALSTNIGGISLSSRSVTTGADGTASTTVRSGNVATAVRVTATISAQDETGSPIELTTVSDELVISTGLPDQNSISLSADKLSVAGGLDLDGIQVPLTVRMADKFNNPVPDGTAATFSTEYGSIESSCTTVGGACSVTWTSQDPRSPSYGSGGGDVKTIFDQPYSCPSHRGTSGPCPDFIGTSGSTTGALSTITVIAIGEEFFTDRNGNGVFDQEEADDGLFVNLPEAFYDYNDDGVFTPAGGGACPMPISLETCSASGFEETFVDFNNNMAYDFNDDPAVYNGVLCPVEGDGVWCSRELVNVRDEIRLLLTSANAGSFYFLLTSSGAVRTSVTEGGNYIVYIADQFNNPPAGGDTVSVTSSGDCQIITETGFEVPDTNFPGAFSIPLAVEGDGNGEDDKSAVTGTVTVTVKTQLGGESSASYSCSTQGELPPAEGDGEGDGDLIVSGG